MGRLSTHVLDTAQGVPGQGVSVKLFSLDGDRHLVASATTNSDGRTDEPLLNEETFRAGQYELEFAVGAYFREAATPSAEPPFLDDVVIRVTLAEGQNYHVPLLVSPWSYSTYRGS
jgi:5-hydroxyisourate hydrolase